MVIWTEGVVREQVPLWSSLIANSMYKAVAKDFPFSFAFTKARLVFDTVHMDQEEIDKFTTLVEKWDKEDPAFLKNLAELYHREILALLEFCRIHRSEIHQNKIHSKRVCGSVSSKDFQEAIDIAFPVFAQTVPLGYCIDPYLEKKVLTLIQVEFGVEAETIFQAISIPSRKNLSMKEQEGILHAAQEPQHLPKNAELLAQQFGWVNVRHFKGQPFSPVHYLAAIQDVMARGARQELLDYEKKQEHIKREAEEAFSSIQNKEVQQAVRVLQEFIYLRTAKKDALTMFCGTLLPMLVRIGQQIGVEEPCYLTYDEILGALRGNFIDKAAIGKRKEEYNYLFEEGKLEILLEAGPLLHEGLLHKTKGMGETASTSQVQGTSAFRGIVQGPAVIVHRKDDLKNIQEGSVLISTMTSPDYTSVIRKSIAIVTDEGGVTCHAAIISREMGKPCVIGTKYATKIFKDGDLVEVDADKGIVRKIK